MLLNKEHKVSSNFWSLLVNPLGNFSACGSAQLAFPLLLLHPTSFVPILRDTVSQVSQLPGISPWFSSKVFICSSRVVEAPKALFQATWALCTAGCTEQLVPINQEQRSSLLPRAPHLPGSTFHSLCYSVHFHPLLSWMGLWGNNKPHVL